MSMTYVIVTACFAAVAALGETLHFIERRDLYDRIMSKDIGEYKRERGGEKPAEHRESAHRRAIKAWRMAGKENNGNGDETTY